MQKQLCFVYLTEHNFGKGQLTSKHFEVLLSRTCRNGADHLPGKNAKLMFGHTFQQCSYSTHKIQQRRRL